MARISRSLIVFTLYLMAFWPAQGFSTPRIDCLRIWQQFCSALNPPKATFERWREAYRLAESQNNTLGAAYALSKMVTMRGKELGVSDEDIQTLQTYQLALQRRNISALHPKPLTWKESFRLWTSLNTLVEKLKSVSNLDILLDDENSVGLKIPVVKRVKRWAKATGKDAAWTLVPYFLRSPIDWHLKFRPLRLGLYPLGIRIRDGDLAAGLGIEQNDFLTHAIDDHFHDETASQRLSHALLGSLVRPYLITFGLMMAGLQPTQLVSQWVATPYDMNHFVGDLNRESGAPEKVDGTVALVDDDLADDGLESNLSRSAKTVIVDPKKDLRAVLKETPGLKVIYCFSKLPFKDRFPKSVLNSLPRDVSIIYVQIPTGTSEMGVPGDDLDTDNRVTLVTPTAPLVTVLRLGHEKNFLEPLVDRAESSSWKALKVGAFGIALPLFDRFFGTVPEQPGYYIYDPVTKKKKFVRQK